MGGPAFSPLSAPARRRRRRGDERRRAGAAGAALAVVVLGSVALAVGVPARPSFLLPAGRDGVPGWLAGPLTGLGPELSLATFSVLVLVMCASYVVALALADAVRPAWVVAAVVLAHLALALSAPILSADVFGYIAYGRLGTVHGLDPYVNAADAAPVDPVYRYVGWTGLPSPYGPLFTLGSYALAPLGVPAALWTLKATMAAASLAAAALVAALAERQGRDPVAAALFVGLNPVALVWGVGGAHNDALVTLLVLAALAAALADRERVGTAVLVAAAAIKATAGLALPFLVLGSRRPRRAAIAALGAGLVAASIALVAFRAGVLGYLAVLADQASFVSRHAIPHDLARLLGLAQVGADGGYEIAPVVRVGALAIFGLAVTALLVDVRRGGDWITATGWATFALLVTTSFLLPWYVIWLLPLAALGESRGLRVAALALCAWVVATRLPLLGG